MLNKKYVNQWGVVLKLTWALSTLNKIRIKQNIFSIQVCLLPNAYPLKNTSTHVSITMQCRKKIHNLIYNCLCRESYSVNHNIRDGSRLEHFGEHFGCHRLSLTNDVYQLQIKLFNKLYGIIILSIFSEFIILYMSRVLTLLTCFIHLNEFLSMGHL